LRHFAKLAVAVVICAVGAAHARDDRQMHSIALAFDTKDAKERLDPGVKLYFGKLEYPAVERVIGEWKTNKKTNAVGKSDQEACQWAFLSAMLQLQKRAREEGGDAVVEIKSVYRDVPTVSETEFVCGAGNLMAGVAFRGKVVKLAP
jgi:uncharacterized protein YbjQ (UPF0145 family)